MNGSARIASCALAVALSLGASPAFADAERVDDSAAVPGGFPEDDTVEETALARACRLIDAIPYDPYKVALSDADAIHAAEDAYAGLTALEQQRLDAQEAASGVLTYGRALQCASWGLAALSPVDDSTPLPDGTYTGQVASTCEMGKSSSNRGYKFTVTKVAVAGGHATATLEHATASPDTVSMGGMLYPHSNTDERAHSTFEVPVDLNSTFHFSQMAKNPTENTIAIPYEMTVTIDEQGAVPDSAPAPEEQGGAVIAPSPTDGTGEGSPSSGENAGKGKRSSKTRSSRQASQRQVRQPSSSAGSVSSVAVASGGGAGRGSGAATGSAAGGSSDASAADAAAVRQAAADDVAAGGKAAAASVAGAPSGARADAAMSSVAVQASGEAPVRPDYPPMLIAGALALAAIGFATFTLGYMRRDREPVRVRGVRLPGER